MVPLPRLRRRPRPLLLHVDSVVVVEIFPADAVVVFVVAFYLDLELFLGNLGCHYYLKHTGVRNI